MYQRSQLWKVLEIQQQRKVSEMFLSCFMAMSPSSKNRKSDWQCEVWVLFLQDIYITWQWKPSKISKSLFWLFHENLNCVNIAFYNASITSVPVLPVYQHYQCLARYLYYLAMKSFKDFKIFVLALPWKFKLCEHCILQCQYYQCTSITSVPALPVSFLKTFWDFSFTHCFVFVFFLSFLFFFFWGVRVGLYIHTYI